MEHLSSQQLCGVGGMFSWTLYVSHPDFNPRPNLCKLSHWSILAKQWPYFGNVLSMGRVPCGAVRDRQRVNNEVTCVWCMR